MAQLNFTHHVNLTNDPHNIEPLVVQTLMLAAEPKGDLYQYFITDKRTKDKHALPQYGIYTDVQWNNLYNHLTTQRIRRIGIKHFPQIGAIGFFTLLHEERSKILAPIHTTTRKFKAPEFSMQKTDTTFIFKMKSPAEVTYICYRIILRLDDFAEEYITYEEELEVVKPSTTGTYDIYCVGYIGEGEAVSEDSIHYTEYVEGIYDTWPGPAENHDLHITDVEVVKGYNVSVARSDGFIKTTDNQIIHPVGIKFDSAGYLQIQLSDGSVMVSENAAPAGGGGSGGINRPTAYALFDTKYEEHVEKAITTEIKRDIILEEVEVSNE